MIEGILSFTKFSGETSFKSLWRVKRGLGTKKIGHTGTLDCFADGLLVVLVGTLTHLVPYFTACDKEYIARIAFGRETDTLDPQGTVVSTGSIPTSGSLSAVLPAFIGTISQTPPLYSAIHVTGMRASDIARKGGVPALSPRPVTIRDITILRDDLANSGTVDIRVSCSKGTYIRSLARDIARACNTVAHLTALRRVRVGPFSLDSSVGFDMIGDFSGYEEGTEGSQRAEIAHDSFERSLKPFDESVARSIGLLPVILHADKVRAFCNGQDLDERWFKESPFTDDVRREDLSRPVYSHGNFLGMVRSSYGRLSYDFVHRVDT